MSSSLASLLTILGIIFLLWRFTVRDGPGQPGLWLPVVWLCLAGSRFVSQWLAMGSGDAAGGQDGSPLDAAVFSTLLAAGLLVLAQRREAVLRVLRDNPLVVTILLYGAVSIAWSDFPAISFKRYVKALGHPVMALIVATEPTPGRAFALVLRRCAFVLMPISILLIKYYPNIGRYYDAWLGTMYNQGAAITKNGLGATTMFFGIVFVWSIVWRQRSENRGSARLELLVDAGALLAALWLLRLTDSATSMAGFLIGASAVVALRAGFARRHVVFWIGGVLPVAVLSVALSGSLRAALIESLGRDATLTDRTFLWADILEIHRSPWLGTGFEAFWLGWRRDTLWEKWWWGPLQSHNGYLEIYIQQGLIGLFIYILIFIVTIARLLYSIQNGNKSSVLCFAIFFVILLHNITEAGFVGMAFVWTLFYCIVFTSRKDVRRP